MKVIGINTVILSEEATISFTIEEEGTYTCDFVLNKLFNAAECLGVDFSKVTIVASTVSANSSEIRFIAKKDVMLNLYPLIFKLFWISNIKSPLTYDYRYRVRCIINGDDSRNDYLNLALPHMQKILRDDIYDSHFLEILRLVREVPIEHRISLVVKLGKILLARYLPNCALNLLALYQYEPRCNEVVVAARRVLSFPSSPRHEEVSEILNTADFDYLIPAFRVRIFGHPQISFASIILFVGDHKQFVFSVLQSSRLTINGRDYPYTTAIESGIGLSEHICVKIINRDDTCLVLENILATLASAGFYLNDTGRTDLRNILGIYKDPDCYTALMQGIVDQIPGDDPSEFMFRWLEQFCFDFDQKDHLQVITCAMRMLSQKGFLQCERALGLNLMDLFANQIKEAQPTISSIRRSWHPRPR